MKEANRWEGRQNDRQTGREESWPRNVPLSETRRWAVHCTLCSRCPWKGPAPLPLTSSEKRQKIRNRPSLGEWDGNSVSSWDRTPSVDFILSACTNVLPAHGLGIWCSHVPYQRWTHQKHFLANPPGKVLYDTQSQVLIAWKPNWLGFKVVYNVI